MENNNFLIYIAGLAIIIVSIFFYTQQGTAPLSQGEVTSFEECVAAGNPVMESYPRQCNDGKGNSFTEDIGNALDKSDLIRVTNITPNQEVKSPLVITGEARGFWYFEASFPATIVDGTGKELAVTPAQAQGEWMTEDFVPFSVTLTFNPGTAKKGKIILKKDNPSGLPEHEDSLEIPITFSVNSTATNPPQGGGCVVGGCSSQLCLEEKDAGGIVTTCEYRDEYACYKGASCKRQQNGKCGWDQTPSLLSCLKNPPQAS